MQRDRYSQFTKNNILACELLAIQTFLDKNEKVDWLIQSTSFGRDTAACKMSIYKLLCQITNIPIISINQSETKQSELYDWWSTSNVQYLINRTTY